jgi:hypothetical protein
VIVYVNQVVGFALGEGRKKVVFDGEELLV